MPIKGLFGLLQRAHTLRRHVVGLVAVTLLPAFMVSGLAVHRAAESYRQSADNRMADTAQALASAVDRELETHLAVLTTLAGSPLLDEHDGQFASLVSFHQHAQRAAEVLQTPIVMIGSDMGQRLRTDRPYGTPLPLTGNPALMRSAIATERPQVGNIAIGAVLQTPVIAIVVPIVRTHRVVGVLSAPMAPARLTKLLTDQGLGQGAFAVINDGAYAVVARSIDADRFVGQPAPPWFRGLIGTRESGISQGTNLNGIEVIFAFHRLRVAPGWVVSRAEPLRTYQQAWRGPILALILGGVVTLASSLAFASWLGRRILDPLSALTLQANALAAGPETQPDRLANDSPALVTEFEGFRCAVQAAQTAMQEREAKRILLAREVDHRAKNALTVALSLVRLTTIDEPKAFRATIEARIRSLARTHNILAERGWSGTELRTLLQPEIVSHPGLTLVGPVVLVCAVAAQSIAMVAHELVTNALKHGALAQSDGRVLVSWEIVADQLHIRWEEYGGPPQGEQSARRGFGMRMIDANIRQQLGGTVTQQWADPFAYAFTIPLTRINAVGFSL